MNNRRYVFLITIALCLLAAVAWARSAQAQSEKGEGCRDDITADGGYKIRSVKVGARYLPDLPSPLPKPGTDYSPELLLPILDDVRQALRKEANREDIEGATEVRLLKAVTIGKGTVEDKSSAGPVISLNFVTSCTSVIAESACKAALGESNSKCVDITIHAVSLRVDTGNPIANLLNVPRSNRPSFLSKVPGPVLAFNPKPGFDFDRTFGPAGTFEMAANLLDLSRNLKSQPLTSRRTRLDLTSTVRRSLNGPFYETATKLSLTRSFSKIDRLGIDASFTADHDPLGENEYSRNAATIGGSMRLRTDFEPFGDIVLNARYRRSSNRFTSRTALPSEFTSENALEASALFDGRLWKGVNRLAIWLDADSPDKNRDGYHRVAALWGYQREFVIVPNQTIGVEALLGGGRAWGAVPQYARFYGGNSARNFLYEAKDSPVVTSFPAGPLLRSFGSGQATARTALAQVGGTSYWNLNLNVSIPLPMWSSPLIPDISIEIPTKDANGRAVLDANQNQVSEDRPLRVILKNQGESSRKVLERTFLKEGLSPSAAKAKSQRELRSINSILGFIADQANIYSFKPLFMFDVARLNAPAAVNNQTRFAVGGGLQFTIVIAKFEAGYMRTLRPLPGDGKGNFVMRLFFQNLF
jgi:hypothetical protein